MVKIWEILVGVLTFGSVFILFWLIIKRQSSAKNLKTRLDEVSGSTSFNVHDKKEKSTFKLNPKLAFKLELMERKLEKLDIPLQAWEYLAIRFLLICPGIIMVMFGWLLQGTLLLILSLIIPELILKIRGKKRLLYFEDQLSNSLLSIANALRAGFSFVQAMNLVCKEEGGALAVEFRRTLQEMNLGTSTEEAMLRLAKRVESEELDLVVTAILVQRQVGGDLAGVLEQIQWTVLERKRLRKEIKSLTAQGRLSGLIIGLMPIFLIFILYVMNPQYMSLLITEKIGRMILIVGLFSEIIGFRLINKIVSIDY